MLRLPSSLLVLIASQALSTTSSHHAPAASPNAQTDLICHTSNPAECYPAIFSPTKDFQIIHDDQSIPPGLHVRMNLATGRKEARLNIPMEHEDTESAVIVIDNPPSDDPSLHPPAQPETLAPHDLALHDQEAQAPLLAHPASNPSPSHASDSETLDTLLQALHSPLSPTSLPRTLSSLTDLAHDAEYGLAITTSRPTITTLLSLLSKSHPHASVEAQSASAALLATSLQNNPQALRALLSHPPSHSDRPVLDHPTTRVMWALAEIGDGVLLAEEDAVFASKLVFLLSQLSVDEGELAEFVGQEGVRTLMKVVYMCGEVPGAEEVQASEALRGKVVGRVANWVVDFGERVARLKVEEGDKVLRDGWDQSLMEVGMEEWRGLCRGFRKTVMGRFERGSSVYGRALEAERVLERVIGGRCE